MGTFRTGRFIGVTVGALVILLVGVYGPATLLGPLPPARATLVTPPAPRANPTPPVLPVAGASAVAALEAAAGDAGGGTVAGAGAVARTTLIASAGSTAALPMAAAAKIVTALVVLDAKPLAVGEAGPKVTISTADYQDYVDYGSTGARTVVVFPGEVWTESELLQAMVLGSSNNHADTLARWAFGSLDAYTAAANAWLAKNGLSGTRVADATGLHDASVGTGPDLARLAGIAAGNPVIAQILSRPASALVGARGVDNTTAYHADDGVTGISRSYTDAAGVVFLFTARIGSGDSVFTFAGALVGEPDYNTLSADLTALMTSARAGVAALPVLAKGDVYVRFSTPWGATASGTVRADKTRVGWQAAAPGAATVTLDALSTGRAGRTIGRVAVQAGGASVSAPLVLDRTISAPGPGWRLLNPIPLIQALIAANS